MKSLIGEKAIGVIIAPSVYPRIKRSFDLKLVIGVGPVKQEEGQLPTVTSNNVEIGRLAADTLGQQADDKEGNIAWIGYEDSQGVQSERARSFVQWISKQYPKLKITGIDNKIDNPEVAYVATKNFISSSRGGERNFYRV